MPTLAVAGLSLDRNAEEALQLQEAAMRVGYGAAALPMWEEFLSRYFHYQARLLFAGELNYMTLIYSKAMCKFTCAVQLFVGVKGAEGKGFASAMCHAMDAGCAGAAGAHHAMC